jgi:hypothetical protein
METLALLDGILYRFRDLFGSQNFHLFCAYIYGTILCSMRHTVTEISQATHSQDQYWSLIKFLSRGKWDWEQVCSRLIWTILPYLTKWVYVYDHTHTVKTGKKQFGLHFFRNHRYRKRNTNQSKFHWGHEFAALGILGLTKQGNFLFPVWVKLLQLGADYALSAFQSAIALIPSGLIIFDRGFNNRKYFKALLEQGHHLLCRARKNAVFYHPAKEPRVKKRGPKPKYGKRASFRHWQFQNTYVEALNKTYAVAHQVVYTKSCPDPVRLVIIKTKPKKNKPYRYFLVYTTDLNLSVETIVYYYDLRWKIETGFRDCKESFGFDHYQVKSETAIQRSVVLSFVAATLTQMMILPKFKAEQADALPEVEDALQEMKIHWYQPQQWTLGLIVKFIRWKNSIRLFSACFLNHKNSLNIQNPLSSVAG